MRGFPFGGCARKRTRKGKEEGKEKYEIILEYLIFAQQFIIGPNIAFADILIFAFLLLQASLDRGPRDTVVGFILARLVVIFVLVIVIAFANHLPKRTQLCLRLPIPSPSLSRPSIQYTGFLHVEPKEANE